MRMTRRRLQRSLVPTVVGNAGGHGAGSATSSLAELDAEGRTEPALA